MHCYDIIDYLVLFLKINPRPQLGQTARPLIVTFVLEHAFASSHFIWMQAERKSSEFSAFLWDVTLDPAADYVDLHKWCLHQKCPEHASKGQREMSDVTTCR